MRALLVHVILACMRFGALCAKQHSNGWSRRLDDSGNASVLVDRQYEALRAFYNSTGIEAVSTMDGYGWFLNGNDDPCAFEGLTCDEEGFVTVIELENLLLDGTLPDVFDSFPRLKHVRLANNSMYSTLPESLLRLQSLRHIQIGQNTFSGTFPDLSDLPVLSRVFFRGNAFSGTLPPTTCRLSTLELLDISYVTGMWGPIPACFAELRELTTLEVTDAGLTGTVPSDLCGWREMNGIRPNQLGCSAIACAAGFFQSEVGRETTGSEGSPCRRCDVPSNVIGATTCQWQSSNRTGMPHLKPSTETPTSVPSRPTQNPTNIVPLPPVGSAFPTSLPPTQSPTPAPIVEQPPQSTSPSSPAPIIERTTQPTPICPAPIIAHTKQPMSQPTTPPGSMAPSTASMPTTAFPTRKELPHSPTGPPRSNSTMAPSLLHISSSPTATPARGAAVVPSEVATPTSPIGTQPSTLYPSTPTPTLNVTASDAARQRIHTTTGFFAAASSLAIVAVFATLVLLWKRRLPEPGHVRFAEDASIDRGLDKRGTDDPATLGDYSDDDDDADSDVFHDDVEEPSYIITPSAVETLATVPKRVPSILKTSLSRDQYNARIKADEGNAIDGSPRKVRFTSPVPLPGPSERMDCRPMTQETNSQQEDDGVWLSWLNPRLDNSITYCGSFERISKPPVDIDSASFQRSAKSNVETDSIISLDSANSTLSAVLAAANDAEYDLYDDESLSQVLQRRVLGIRDRADLQAAARSRYAVGASRKDGDIFRRRDGRPPSSPAIRVVSVHVPNDFALGDEFGEV